MDVRRASRVVIDPKVRRVGFFAHTEPDKPEPGSPPLPDSPLSDPLSPVIIPPPRQLTERTAAVPVPESKFRRQELDDQVPVGSYNPSQSLLGTSPADSISSSSAGFINGEFSEDRSGVGWFRGSELSFPGGGLDLPSVKPREILAENIFPVVAVNVKNLPGGTGMLIFVIEFNLGYV